MESRAAVNPFFGRNPLLSTVVRTTGTPALSRMVCVMRIPMLSRMNVMLIPGDSWRVPKDVKLDGPDIRGTERMNMLVVSSGNAVTLL